MKYDEFIEAAAQRAGVSRDRAAALIRATLQTLAEHLTAGEADDLASELPKQMKEWLTRTSPTAEAFGLDEFIRRVSERAQMPPDEAREGARAVFATLHEAVSGGEFSDVMSQLPNEFAELVEA